MAMIEYKAKLKGEFDIDEGNIFIGESEIRTILPEHYIGDVIEIEVKIYKREKNEK